MEAMNVDDFVQARVLPELQPVVEMIRGLMRECAPGVQELIAYDLPAYKGRRILAFISPNKRDITFSFTRGVQFEDRYHLLKGAGKSTRHVKMKSVASANQEALRYYIQQALEWDEK